MPSIVIADDDDGVRTALRDLFEDDPRFSLVGEATDAEACVSLVANADPDVVVLDARMPGSGLAAAQQLNRVGARAAVVVLSSRLDAALLAELIKADVRGAFDKGSSSAELPDLVARCAGGERLLHARATADALRLLGG